MPPVLTPGSIADLGGGGAGSFVELTGDVMSGELSVPDLLVQGIGGSTVDSRLVGAVASGAPASGTYAVGDLVLDQAGSRFWQNMVAGAPGTWARLGGDSVIAYAESDATQSGITTVTDITGLVVSNFVVTTSALVLLFCPYTFGSSAAIAYEVQITDGSNVTKNKSPQTASGASHVENLVCFEHITSPGTHTRKGRINRLSASGSCGIGAGTGNGYFQAILVLGS